MSYLQKHKRNIYRSQTKLREGNVFTPDCQSFCSQGGVHGRGGMCGRRGMHGRERAWNYLPTDRTRIHIKNAFQENAYRPLQWPFWGGGVSAHGGSAQEAVVCLGADVCRGGGVCPEGGFCPGDVHLPPWTE